MCFNSKKIKTNNRKNEYTRKELMGIFLEHAKPYGGIRTSGNASETSRNANETSAKGPPHQVVFIGVFL
jgi:hypothetical protein